MLSPGVIYCSENIKYWLQYKLPQYFIRNSISSPPTLDKDQTGEEDKEGGRSHMTPPFGFVMENGNGPHIVLLHTLQH